MWCSSSLVETKIAVDACIWDEFLVTAAVFELPTIAIPQGFAGFDEVHPFLCNKARRRLSAAPDARSLQVPAKDPRLKTSGRR